MYDDVNEFDELKARYLNIAKGGVPTDVEKFKIDEKAINICDLLVKVNFAPSKAEAKRMVKGNGVKINGKIIDDISEEIEITDNTVLQFGKNKYKKIISK